MSKKVRRIFIFLTLFLLVIFSIFIYFKKSTQKISDYSKITSTRIIVVDKNLNILQIISYTKKEIEPVVRLENEQGMEISMTDYISEQYSKIKPFINFSKTGVVFDERPLTFFGITLPNSLNKFYLNIKKSLTF